MFNPAPTHGVTEERFHDEAYAREAWRTNCFNGSGLGPRAGRLFRNKHSAGASWPSGSSCLASCYSLPSRPTRSCCARQPCLRAPPMCPQESTLKWSLQVEISSSPFPPCAPAGVSGSGDLKSVSSPAIPVGRSPVVKRIVIDVSVVGIEAVVAGIGAAVAPIVAVPTGPGMAFSIDRSEICCRRLSAGATENGDGNCCRNQEMLHDDAQNPMKPELSLTSRTHDANQNSRLG